MVSKFYVICVINIKTKTRIVHHESISKDFPFLIRVRYTKGGKPFPFPTATPSLQTEANWQRHKEECVDRRA